MQFSPHIAALCLLSLIYFIFSAGGLAALYFYYEKQIYLLEKELSKHTSDLATEGKVLTNVYDVETGGRREDEDIEDESSSEISSYHDYKDETSLPLYCCIGNETNLKQVGYLLTIWIKILKDTQLFG